MACKDQPSLHTVQSTKLGSCWGKCSQQHKKLFFYCMKWIWRSNRGRTPCPRKVPTSGFHKWRAHRCLPLSHWMAADNKGVKRQDRSPPEKGASSSRNRYKPIRPASPRCPYEPPQERPTIYSSVGDMERQEMERQRLMNLIYNFTTQFSHLKYTNMGNWQKR